MNELLRGIHMYIENFARGEGGDVGEISPGPRFCVAKGAPLVFYFFYFVVTIFSIFLGGSPFEKNSEGNPRSFENFRGMGALL